MFFETTCVICKLPIEEINGPLVQAQKTVKITITHAICSLCYEKTKEKWTENEWEITFGGKYGMD